MVIPEKEFVQDNEFRSVTSFYEEILQNQSQKIPTKDTELERIRLETEQKVSSFLARFQANELEDRITDNPVICEVIRCLDQSFVSERTILGHSRGLKRIDLNPESLREIVDALQTKKFYLDEESIRNLLLQGISLTPQLIEDFRFEFRDDEASMPKGPRAGKRLRKSSMGSGDSSFANPRELRTRARRSHREEFLSRYRITESDEEMQAARLLAATRGEVLTAENKNRYINWNKVIQQLDNWLTSSELNKDQVVEFYEKITKPTEDDLEYWKELAPVLSVPNLNINDLKRYSKLLQERFLIGLMEKSSLLTSQIVEEIYDQQLCTDESLLKYLSKEKVGYYLFFISSPESLKSFLKLGKTNFQSLVERDGEPTKKMLVLIAEENPQLLIKVLTKARFSILFGGDVAQSFLSVLPKESDERRNAFTHNDYDRTSQFLDYLVRMPSIDYEILDDSEIVSQYIAEFGLSKSAEIFNVFKQVYLYENGLLSEKSQILTEYDIETVEILKKEIKELQELITSEDALTAERLQSLTVFQKKLLPVVTGKTTHRFDSGRVSFDRIMADFIRDESEGNIEMMSPEYQTETYQLFNVEIEFDASPIEEDFRIIAEEIKSSIENRRLTQDLVDELVEVLNQRLIKSEESLALIPEKGQKHARIKIDKLKNQIDRLKHGEKLNLDALLIFISTELNFGKRDQSYLNSLRRKIVLRKTFEQHFSPHYIESLLSSLDKDITSDSVMSVLNVINELIKQHVLSTTHQEQGVDQYWSADVQKLLMGKDGKGIRKSFSDIREKLQATIDSFEYIEQSSLDTIKAIPSRDFIAEMSGYIADVCYTKEYPLLKGRDVVPYKFVSESNKEIEGSVLVFEVTDADGNECLLIRGFDYKDETNINVSQLIERFLDDMEDLARRKGKKYVLVPGLRGAISNYDMTITHIVSKYVDDASTHHLGDTFDFNGYDLTNNCFVVRTV